MGLSATDLLKLGVSADTAGAVKAFDSLGKQIKGSLGDAEKQAQGLSGKLGAAFDSAAAKSPALNTALGKLGITGQQAGAAIASAIPVAAVTAGAAIGAFALKGAQDFANLGLAVDSFAQSSGLSLDQASRWLEVAGDLGISTDTVSTAFIKMEKAISTNRAAFGDLVKTGKDGGVDLTATFLAVSDHLKGIKDPIDRAAESSKLFGKGFSQVAQLLGLDAEDLKKRLEGVADVKVFNAEKEAQVKRYRDQMANLRDTIEEVQLTLGQHLLPQLTKLAGFATNAIEIVVDVKGIDERNFGGNFGLIAGEAMKAANPVALFNDLVDKANKIMNGGGGKSGMDTPVVQSFDAIAKSADQMGQSIGPAANSIVDFTRQASSAASINTIYGGSADAAAENLLREKGGSDEAATAAQSHAKALDDVLNSQLALVDSSFAQHKLTLDVVNAQKDLTKAQQDGTKTALELQVQTDDVVASAIALASKNKEVEASAHGADAGNQAFSDTLQFIANTSSPEVKAQLEGVIGKLKDTGDQHPKPTVDLTDNATTPLTGISTTITGLNGKQVSFTINANTDSANTKLDNLARRLSALASTGLLVNAPVGGIVKFAEGGMVPGSKGHAMPAIVHGGEYVLPAKLVDQISRGQKPSIPIPSAIASSSGQGGPNVYITVQGAVDPYNTARQIKQILAQGSRSGFSTLAA